MTKSEGYLARFLKGHERTVRAKKHILYSALLKVISLVSGLIMVPLALGYLDAERYGVWLTLSSVISWMSFFDIGIGNGLRNRFAEAVAKDDYRLARVYVSSTYAAITTIILLLMFVFPVANANINWQTVLNTKVLGQEELSRVASIIFVFFMLKLIFQLIGVILMADQRPAMNSFFESLSSVLVVVSLYMLLQYGNGALPMFAMITSGIPVSVFLVATLLLFGGRYRRYRPSLSFVEISRSKDLLSLGVKFFYYQVSFIVFFSTSNVLIAQFSSQADVAAYNVAYKYFFIGNMIYAIILTPFWSAVTDAHAREDYVWLRRSLRQLNILSIVIALGILMLLLISPQVYGVWVGDRLNISFLMSAMIALYLIEQVFVAPFSIFINGLGKLKIGLYMITVKLVLFFPLAYVLGEGYGATGIVAAMAIIQVPSLIQEAIQVRKVVNRTASGIWNQ